MILKTRRQGPAVDQLSPGPERIVEKPVERWLDPDLQSARRRRWILLAVLALLATAVVAGYRLLARDLAAPAYSLIYQRVTRGDLPITVVERGNLESQDEVEILCEVDDVGGDNLNGTQMLWLVPNGSSVKQGDLLVQLDEASHLERLDRQALDTEQARAVKISADVRFENQITQNETSLADAGLEVKLAELELQMFRDPENGSYKLEVDTIERLIEDVNNEILAAQASLELKRNESDGIETLFKLGYAGKRQLDQSRLEYLQAESQVAAKLNKLETQRSTLEKKTSYEQEMQLLSLIGKLDSSERRLVQVKRNNEALLTQAKAAKDAADQAFKKEQEFLERYTEQVTKCKIYAPQDGMVAYAVGSSRYSSEEIREGACVRPRQRILTLPNLTRMEVKTSVHESVLDYIKAGLPATIRVDAFPGRTYKASVASVAVLPDSGGWYGTDTKVYETVVTIDEEVQQLKPGMTAVVEINVDRLTNVLMVPVQAVVQVEDANYVFVRTKSRPEQRSVVLGRTNDKFVQLVSGIQDSQEVVLNPMVLVDEIKSERVEESAAEETSNDLEVPPPASDLETPPIAAPPAVATPAGAAGQPRVERGRESAGEAAGPPSDRPRKRPPPQSVP